MQDDNSRPKLAHGGAQPGARAQGLFAKVLTVVVGAALLVGTIAFSIVLFAITLTGLLVFGIYLWWHTRHVRRQMRDYSAAAGGDIIEGEVIRDVSPEGKK